MLSSRSTSSVGKAATTELALAGASHGTSHGRWLLLSPALAHHRRWLRSAGSAFRALGLPKRDGTKLEMDREMFNSFDTSGDGFCDLAELEAGLQPKTRKKIEEKLDAG